MIFFFFIFHFIFGGQIFFSVTASTGFVGTRIPSHPIAQRLLEMVNDDKINGMEWNGRRCTKLSNRIYLFFFLPQSQLPIAAPSANRFGHVSPTRAIHVMEDLGEFDIGIIDGGDEFADCTCR